MSKNLAFVPVGVNRIGMSPTSVPRSAIPVVADLAPDAAATIIRSSSLTSYPGCNRRGATFLLRQEIKAAGFDVRDSPSTIAAATGTAVHESATVTLQEKAKTGSLPPLSFCEDVAITDLQRSIHDGITYDKDSPGVAAAEYQVRRMTTVYRYAIAPGINPLVVEERFEAAVPWARQKLVVSGQPDVICREPDDVDDLKTGARLGSHAPQIGSYSLIARSHKIEIKGAKISWIQRVSMKKPQPGPATQTYEISQAEGAAVAVINQIDRDLTTFREGDPTRGILPGDPVAFASNPTSMLCGQKYCPNYGVRGPHAFCRDWEPKENITR